MAALQPYLKQIFYYLYKVDELQQQCLCQAKYVLVPVVLNF